MVDNQFTLVFLLLHVFNRLFLNRERGEFNSLSFQEEGGDYPVIDAVIPMGFRLEFGHLVGLHNVVYDAFVELDVVFLLAELDHEVFAVTDVFRL